MKIRPSARSSTCSPAISRPAGMFRRSRTISRRACSTMRGAKRGRTRISTATSPSDAAPRMDAAVPRLPHRPAAQAPQRRPTRATKRSRRGSHPMRTSSCSARLSRLMLEVIPQDPSRDEYRQGTTLGPRHRHWRRARIGRRFRLFFRYDARAKVIVYAWVNDQRTLRSSGSRTDPYSVFARMLARGSPSDDWASLIAASRQDWPAGK